jgi:hypothetical protein
VNEVFSELARIAPRTLTSLYLTEANQSFGMFSVVWWSANDSNSRNGFRVTQLDDGSGSMNASVGMMTKHA